MNRSLARLCVLPLLFALAMPAAAAESFAASPLARLAQRIAPGDAGWLETRLPAGVTRFGQLLVGYRADGSLAPAIDTWTDAGSWDPVRKQIYFQGLRKSNRFLAYDAATNAWRELSLDKPGAPPKFENFGHMYGRTTLDAKRGHFYRLAASTLHRYVIDEERWETLDAGPLKGYIPIAWHAGLDALVGLQNSQVQILEHGQWRPLGKASVTGYHSSGKYNPKRNDMLFIGGTDSRREVTLVTAEGHVQVKRAAPFEYGISADDLTHDPVSGNYLVLTRDRVLWEYSPDRDEWRMALDMRPAGSPWPFARDGIVPIPIDELGVIVWNSAKGALLYRHRSVFAG